MHLSYSFCKFICVGFFFLRTHLLAKHCCFSDTSHSIVYHGCDTYNCMELGKNRRNHINYYRNSIWHIYLCLHFKKESFSRNYLSYANIYACFSLCSGGYFVFTKSLQKEERTFRCSVTDISNQSDLFQVYDSMIFCSLPAIIS